MATKKTLDMGGLVATKGAAAPVSDMPTRSSTPATQDAEEGNSEPLNFRVTADFRRRFRMFAAAQDLKLNELLRLAFDDYERRHNH